MLHRIVSHSTGFARRTVAQHKFLPFAGGRSQQTKFLSPRVAPSLSTFRHLSTNNKNGSSKIGSSSDPEKKLTKDAKGNRSIASPNSVEASSIDIGNHKLQQPEAEKMTQTAKPISSESILPQASTTTTESNIRKDSTTDVASTPTSGEIPIPPPMKSIAAEGGVILTKYYDMAYKLWSERSGTTEILALKESVNEAGAAFDTASAAVTTNRRNLDEALRKWERASGQHLQLLQRRESWTPEDAQRFADFVSLEITTRAELEQARHDLARSEESLTKAQLDYINKMRRRYHEEQIWQDQWRVLGTYGTWSLIVLNSCVFLGSQYFQRRRERDRMETIERLITENRIEGIGTEVQNASVDQDTSELPEKTATVEDNTKNNVVSPAESIDEKSTEIDDEEQKSDESDEQHQSDDSLLDDSENTSKSTSDEPKHPAIERIEAAAFTVGSFLKKWDERLRSDANNVVKSIHQKVRQALPADIEKEIPKSVSEIHVPSAVIGASVGGIAVLTISMIISAFSSRK